MRRHTSCLRRTETPCATAEEATTSWLSKGARRLLRRLLWLSEEATTGRLGTKCIGPAGRAKGWCLCVVLWRAEAAKAAGRLCGGRSGCTEATKATGPLLVLLRCLPKGC